MTVATLMLLSGCIQVMYSVQLCYNLQVTCMDLQNQTPALILTISYVTTILCLLHA